MTGTQVVGLPAEQGCYGSTRLPWDCQDVFHGCELYCCEFQNTQEIWNVWGYVTVQNGRNRCIKHSKYAEGRLQIYVSSSHVHPAVRAFQESHWQHKRLRRFFVSNFSSSKGTPGSPSAWTVVGHWVVVLRYGAEKWLHSIDYESPLWIWRLHCNHLFDLILAFQIASFEIIELWIWCLSSWKSTMKWSLGSCVVHNQGVDQNLLCFLMGNSLHGDGIGYLKAKWKLKASQVTVTLQLEMTVFSLLLMFGFHFDFDRHEFESLVCACRRFKVCLDESFNHGLNSRGVQVESHRGLRFDCGLKRRLNLLKPELDGVVRKITSDLQHCTAFSSHTHFGWLAHLLNLTYLIWLVVWNIWIHLDYFSIYW